MRATFLRRLRRAPTLGRLITAYATLAVLKHFVSLPRLARWAWIERRAQRDNDAEFRMVTAVSFLRRWVGRGDDCLQSSLLLYRELSRLGADPMLVVGFRREGDRVEGHAWVFVDGRTIPNESHARPFASAFQFGRKGTLVIGHDVS